MGLTRLMQNKNGLSFHHPGLRRLIQLTTMFCWILLLSNTSSYYVIYLMIGLAGIYCRHAIHHCHWKFFSQSERMNTILSSVFSLVVIAANYDMFHRITKSIYHSLSIHKQLVARISLAQFMHYKVFVFLFFYPILFLGGMYTAFFILKFLTEKAADFTLKIHSGTKSNRQVFFYAWMGIGLFYLMIMLSTFYPGFFCPDTITQVKEILSGSYTNRNPFYHTMLVRLFILTGKYVFHNINFGAALYSIFSIAFLSCSFAYAVVTLYQLQLHLKIILAVSVFYALMPYNILFSFNMWKDTPFGASVLIFTVALFRYLKGIGNNAKANFMAVLAGGLGVCLFRGNGLIVVFITLIAFFFAFGKTDKKMLCSLASVLAAALILTYPLLSVFHIEQSDIVELSSMPIQQIARTVKENDDLSDSQKKLIKKVADIETVKQRYDPGLSDPLKIHLREKGSQDYIQQHKSEYVLLYFQLGIKHPKSYFTAWIDQTKGYWNGGYDSVKFSYAFSDNQVGLKRQSVLGIVEKAVFLYCTSYEILDLLRPFVSIGLHTWLMLLVAFVGFRKKDRIMVFLTVPSLSIIFSLLLGTPVFAEFRYAYPLFCCLPFAALALFAGKTEKNLHHKQIQSLKGEVCE